MLFSIAQMTFFTVLFVKAIPVFTNDVYNGIAGLVIGLVLLFLLTKTYIHKAEITFSADNITIKPTSFMISGKHGDIVIPKSNLKHYALSFQRGQHLLRLKTIAHEQSFVIFLNSKNYSEVWSLLRELMPEKGKK